MQHAERIGEIEAAVLEWQRRDRSVMKGDVRQAREIALGDVERVDGRIDRMQNSDARGREKRPAAAAAADIGADGC
jgi:hypothetical protein